MPVLTDVHEDTPLDEVAAVVDVLQTPALLCRQTDFIRRRGALRQAREPEEGPVPRRRAEMCNVVDKARSTGNESLLVCERGVSFGYNNLVVDMRSLAILRRAGCPVVFDATHSVQRPARTATSSGGERRARARARARGGRGGRRGAVPRDASGSRGGAERRPDVVAARSRGAVLLEQLTEIDAAVKARPLPRERVPLASSTK